ncbi:hypothetical protein [Lactobacillus johnsonii]|uniref:hypothetical protein n=1 Tax=Lactobacillus johnsonii TaxID=33959 RepID=UPI001FF0CC00|nr:hypothetical protein [Lactobacillus johnsonii]
MTITNLTKEQKKIISDWRKSHGIDQKERLAQKCTELGTSLIKQEKGPALEWAQEQLDLADLFEATAEANKLFKDKKDSVKGTDYLNTHSSNSPVNH